MAYSIGAITNTYIHSTLIYLFILHGVNSDCLLNKLIIKQIYKDFNRTAVATKMQTSCFLNTLMQMSGWETMQNLTANTWNVEAAVYRVKGEEINAMLSSYYLFLPFTFAHLRFFWLHLKNEKDSITKI